MCKEDVSGRAGGSAKRVRTCRDVGEGGRTQEVQKRVVRECAGCLCVCAEVGCAGHL